MAVRNIVDSRVAICDDSITNTMILAALMESECIKNVHSFKDQRKLMAFLQKDRFLQVKTELLGL